MPCVVPNCDPKGQCFAVHFPASYLLSQRWKQAIELGSGQALPEDVSPLEAEICQQHFCEFDDYGEPVIFWNESQHREIRVSSCRLCLQFTLPTHTVSNWHDLMLGELTVKQLLRKILQTDCDDSEALDCSICQECLVRLDMLATMYGQIVHDAKKWKKMQGLSKHERRVWNKISTATKDSTTTEKPTSSDAILLQVEMSKEDPVGDETKSVVSLQSEDEENGVIHSEEPIMVNEGTDEELSEIPEGGNCAEEQTEQQFVNAKHDKRKKQTKSSEKTKSSDQKAAKSEGVGKRKYKKRERKDPPKRKMYLKELNSRKCYLCEVIFDSHDELLAHLLEHRDEDLVCGNCSETFSCLPSYNRHLAKHDPTERPMQCNHCSLRYKDSRGLRIHEELKHHIDHGGLYKVNRREKAFTCQYCGQVFNVLKLLQSHEDRHTGNKRFKCKHCDKAFTLRPNLERHCMQKHTSVKPFKCNICTNIFRKSTSYEEHRKSCNPEIIQEIVKNGKPCNTCRFCSVEFQEHPDLVDHVVEDHSNEEVNFVRCNICRRRFLDKYHYAVHMEKHRTAMGKANLRCRHCPKLCRSEIHLETHEQSHKGGPKFVCKHCSKTFTESGNLVRHLRLHTGEKPYQCDVCDKRFASAEQRRIHVLIHTGEKPFECKSCGKRFRDPSTLYRHRKNVCNDE